MKHQLHLALAATGALLVALPTQAGRLDLDVNAIRVDAGGTFSLDYTGQLDIIETNATRLVDVSLNHKSLLVGPREATIDGYIDLVSGIVTGGMFELVVLDDGDTYTARVVEDSGKAVQAIRQKNRFQLGGLTFQGQFTDANNDGLFAGVNLDSIDFDNVFSGNFLLHDYKPDSTGVGTADIEFRAVPLPASALLGAPLLIAVPLTRRILRRIYG